FNEILCERSAIHRDEGRLASRAKIMKRTGSELFACAGLTADEHGARRRRVAKKLPVHVLHHGRRTHETAEGARWPALTFRYSLGPKRTERRRQLGFGPCRKLKLENHLAGPGAMRVAYEERIIEPRHGEQFAAKPAFRQASEQRNARLDGS